MSVFPYDSGVCDDGRLNTSVGLAVKVMTSVSLSPLSTQVCFLSTREGLYAYLVDEEGNVLQDVNGYYLIAEDS